MHGYLRGEQSENPQGLFFAGFLLCGNGCERAVQPPAGVSQHLYLTYTDIVLRTLHLDSHYGAQLGGGGERGEGGREGMRQNYI